MTSEASRRGRWRPEARRAVRRSIGRAVLWVVGALVLYDVLPLDPASDAAAIVRVGGGAVVLLLVVAGQTIAVVRAPHAGARAIEALAFNEKLSRTGALYFTVVTLATIGYGDVAPRTDTARAVVMAQIVVNIVILGSAIKVISELARRGRRDVVEGDAA